MDHIAAGKGPNSVEIQQRLPHLADEAVYQILEATFGYEIPWLPT